jgi:hypothetical protein
VVEVVEVAEFQKSPLTHIRAVGLQNFTTSTTSTTQHSEDEQMTHKVKDLNRDQLMALAQDTYDKEQWSPDDVYTLRACWEEFERRGFGQPVIFFAPTYFGVLKVHEVESGEVDEERVQMHERTGAEIAQDYREIMRKLRGVDVMRYEEPSDIPEFDESEALDELIRITSEEAQNHSSDC